MQDLGEGMALSMTSEMLWTAIKLAAPLIGITTVVGLLVSILQSVTQIQESSLTFVPKLIAAAAVLLLLGGWMLSVLGDYAIQLISNIPSAAADRFRGRSRGGDACLDRAVRARHRPVRQRGGPAGVTLAFGFIVAHAVIKLAAAPIDGLYRTWIRNRGCFLDAYPLNPLPNRRTSQRSFVPARPEAPVVDVMIRASHHRVTRAQGARGKHGRSSVWFRSRSLQQHREQRQSSSRPRQ
jgi:flagellar biosynthetic protein FliQ